MSTIPLNSSITIQSVTADHAELCELVKSISSPVDIDASTIEEIDTAGMQLLLALINQLKSQSIEPSWKSPSDVLLQTAEILGMSEALSLPAVGA